MRVQRSGFNARARVVDLLGRQQIGDAQTAISELLKNCIDAQASNASLAYNSQERTLLIEDDGLGMRLEDVTQRWLTLATATKETGFDAEWLAAAETTELKPLGEKGIGRLAMAMLGRGALVWTRWVQGGDVQQTLVFVHWNVFQNPQLTLNDIQIPVLAVPQGQEVSVEHLRSLLGEMKEWLLETRSLWRGRRERKLWIGIMRDLAGDFHQSLKGLLPLSTARGTMFAVLGCAPEVDELFDRRLHGPATDMSESASLGGLHLLVGFNEFLGLQPPRLDVELTVNGQVQEIQASFWNSEDLKRVDHELDLTFHADGSVTGQVRRFQETFPYEFSSPILPSRSAAPGPFRLRLGYVEGVEKASSLSPAEFEKYTTRLKRYGGLYIYRDGVRVLPYGRTDQDFLEFEARRNLNAGKYFFSYRRMFGSIALTVQDNPGLRDKAGREGFIRNSQFRGFQYILRRVFEDLAGTYYGSGAGREDKVRQKRRREEERAAKVQERARLEKQRFTARLDRWVNLLPAFRDEISSRLEFLEHEIDLSAQSSSPSVSSVDLISSFEKCHSLVQEHLSELGASPPAAVVLDVDEARRFDDYIGGRDALQGEAMFRLTRAAVAIDESTGSRAPGSSLVGRISEEYLDSGSQRLRQAADAFAAACRRTADQLVPLELQRQLDQFQYTSTAKSDDPAEVAGWLTSRQNLLLEDLLPVWESATRQIEAFADSRVGEAALAHMARLVEALKREDENVTHLAQIGLVAEGLEHDYFVLFARLRNIISELQTDLEDQGGHVSESLSALAEGFSALDEQQQFLRPLYRREVGANVDVSGIEILQFIQRLFPAARREGVQITAGPELRNVQMVGVNRAVLFAATANVVANALYWARQGASKKYEVRFTPISNGYVISNSGPPVAERDRDRIFEAFFGRRPGGRGLGLYLARTTLDHIGVDLSLAPFPAPGALRGANFIIKRTSVTEP